MITFDDIQKANAAMKTTDIKGRPYMEVNQRIKAFRMLFPEGFIRTEIVSIEDGVCVMRAHVGYNLPEGDPVIIGEGTAYEKETSSFINKTSYIENCETSAVGRALGMAGFGIDTSVASYEEVSNAIAQQEADKQPKKAKGHSYAPEPEKSRETASTSSQGYMGEKEWKTLQAICKEKGKDPNEILFRYGYDKPSEATIENYYDMIKALEEGKL